jgi:hypothetical protein
MWKGRRIFDCLGQQCNTDLGEEEMLGDLKEGGQISRIGTGSSGLNIGSTEERLVLNLSCLIQKRKFMIYLRCKTTRIKEGKIGS